MTELQPRKMAHLERRTGTGTIIITRIITSPYTKRSFINAQIGAEKLTQSIILADVNTLCQIVSCSFKAMLTRKFWKLFYPRESNSTVGY
jgi:hypothetical protein